MANVLESSAGAGLSARKLVMLFATQLPLSSLIEFCRVLRHNLAAGLTLPRVIRQQAERGPLPVRPVASRIAAELEQGESLEVALKRERAAFPPMFIALVTVGEKTGCMPDVFGELEKYFLLQQRLQRQFFSQVAWPLLQFFAAPFVIAMMIYVLAVLTPSGTKPFDPLGLGYTGVWGAIKFLLHFFGSIAALVGLYVLATRSLQRRATVHELLLRMPVIGPCLTAIALWRFCMALRMTMNTGMSIVTAVRLSLRATSNAAFAARADKAREVLRGGEDLAQALAETGVFPQDFLDIIANAEEGGRVPEVMRHQAEFYEEETRRRLTILARAASGAIWLMVAGMLIFMIFRIATGIYGGGGPYDPRYWGA
jgi:type IV pilus assembly protein PilC